MVEEICEVDEFDEIELLLDKIPNFFLWNNQKAEVSESKEEFMDSWWSSLLEPQSSADMNQVQWLPHTSTFQFSDRSPVSTQNSCSGSSERCDTFESPRSDSDSFERGHRGTTTPTEDRPMPFRRGHMHPYIGWCGPYYCPQWISRPLRWFGPSHGNLWGESESDRVTFLLGRLRAESRSQHCDLDSFDGVDMCALAKDQNGCRLLQGMFKAAKREDVKRSFFKIIDHVLELVVDPFGNYLVQKLIDVSTEWQISWILFLLTRCPMDLVAISCNIHGTRVVQRLIESLSSSEQFLIMASSLKPGIVTLFMDQNGSHVVACFLRSVSPEYTGFIFEVAAANCVEVATNQHGCCLIQKLLNHYREEQSHSLFHKITHNALLLSQHQYGNYAVQYVLFLRVAWATMDVMKRLCGSYGVLSRQKYSSNVVEKCLLYGDQVYQLDIVHELLDYPRFSDLLQDQYGNYVIQSALNFSKGRAHNVMVKAIRPYAHTLKAFSFGKKILSSCGIKR